MFSVCCCQMSIHLPLLVLYLATFSIKPLISSTFYNDLKIKHDSFPLPAESKNSSNTTSSLTSALLQQLQKLESGSSYKGSSYHQNNANQNLLNLVRNVDARLLIMRNVEMSITTIQEIFDSMGFFNAKTRSNTDDNDSHNIDSTVTTVQLLETFCNRLAKKLDSAAKVVMELRNFFHTNISEYNLKNCNQSGNQKMAAVKIKVNQRERSNKVNASCDIYSQQLFLNTYIEQLQDESSFKEISPNYNKEQIQILNYLKTRSTQNKKVDVEDVDVENFNDDFFNANCFVINKIRSLRSSLTNSDFKTLQSSNNKNSTFKAFRIPKNNFKHIFFLSRSDHAGSNSVLSFYNDIHFRHLYVSTILKKFVFLLIDVGAALSMEQLDLTKTFASNVINLLSYMDLVTIVTVSNDARSVLLNTNQQKPKSVVNNVYAATRDYKEELLKFINDLHISKKFTNHSQGFDYSFKLIKVLEKSNLIDAQTPIEFVYITRGFLTNLSDAMHVLSVIANGQGNLKKPIIINTCAVVSDEKRIMYEKQFLRDIAQQNYSKYDVNISSWYGNQCPQDLAGSFFVITKKRSDIVLRASTAIFEHLFKEPFLAPNLVIHEPVVDKSSSDFIVSFTQAVPPFGVVGVNLYLSDLVEDVVNYIAQENKYQHSYAFLIDRNGHTIAHPAFPNPNAQNKTPFPVDIGFLENSTDFATIRYQMLNKLSGNFSTSIYYTWDNVKPEQLKRSYVWRRVMDTYILCLATTSKSEPFINMARSENVGNFMPMKLSTSVPIAMGVAGDNSDDRSIQHSKYISLNDLLYHRLDLISSQSTSICRYFRQIATFDAATIYLSTLAFESPFAYLQNNHNSFPNFQLRTVESIMAYLKDTTGLLANPGLRPHVRKNVRILYKAMRYLKKRHQDTRGTLKNYIIRRYIATVNGVMQVYPGCLISNDFDPATRSWFRKAMQHPGKIVATEPYLDAGGAGYIITLAHTIFEGKSNALHSSERDIPIAIVALDLPYAFFYKLIVDSTPLCRQSNVKCLLFENRGYLVAHPSMLEPSTVTYNQRRPHEHLTHKESFLANDILYHKMLVKKLACTNYQNRTIQRYYVFNTSLTETLTNVVHGERTKYAITLIHGSNIFAAFLNSTCDGGAFCPCSTIDRTCLNCNRMDQTDCECPCECPMDLQEQPTFLDANQTIGYTSIFSNFTSLYSYCDPTNYEPIRIPIANNFNLLHSCVNINCDIYSTQTECLAAIGCEWCQLDQNGNQFTSSFCTSQLSCFNGVLSSLSPYGDTVDGSDVLAVHVYNTGQKQNSYSAFGPIGGAIIVLSLIIGFAIYCYRYNLDSHPQEQFYIDSLQEDNYGVPLSRFNFDNCQDNDAPGGCDGSDDIGPTLQHNFIHTSNISPYHMSPASSYHRPPNGESDHGYSTMTPHEDFTDHQSFTLVEPLLLNDKLHSKSDTISISTSISSPTNRYQQYHNPYMHVPQEVSKENTLIHKSMSKDANPLNSIITHEQRKLKNPKDDRFCMNHILAPVTVHRHMETSGS